MKNPNHPKKGSVIEIEPLRTPEEVARVREVLDNPRDRALFEIGIQTNLRVSDVLQLKQSDINWKKSEIVLRESKTKKKRHIELNKRVMDALKAYIVVNNPDALLFPITLPYVDNLVKTWTMKAGLWKTVDGKRSRNFGARTMRKSWCYIHWQTHGIPIEKLSKMMNHSSPSVTYRYLGILREEERAIYLAEI